MIRRRGEGDSGAVIGLTVILLVPLVALAAFSVDVGGWYVQATKVQRAADAAATAGVVWMPDLAKSSAVAQEVASRNGYTHDPSGTGVTVTVTSFGPQQLRVVIHATSGQFLGRIAAGVVNLNKTATAEYMMPVPLGSPRNFLGTGNLATGFSENLWMSVNAWCSDKADGDRYQSRFTGNRPYNGSSASCPANPATSAKANPEYRTTGYELIVEVPDNRTSPVDVLLYDARYSPADTGSPDLQLYSGSSSFVYTVFEADDTPLDDSDNPPMATCPAITYTRTTAFSTLTYLDQTRWNTLCTISVSDPAGRYIVRVQNTSDARYAAGANNYSVIAKYQNATGTGLCDARTDATCPKVYGNGSISVFADQSGSQADFFLSEISAEFTGKTLSITLFDPGEGGDNIHIRKPTATGFTDATFTWTASNGAAGSGTSLDVRNSVFNGQSVVIKVDLAGYAPPTNNAWWQIRYNFTAGATVTDRTTWSAAIQGYPVHLIE